MNLESDLEEFKKIWKNVFFNFPQREKNLDEELSRMFSLLANDYSLEDVRELARYILDNFKKYPCFAEIREVFKLLEHERYLQAIAEYERQANEKFLREEAELRAKIESMSPEELKEHRRKCQENIRGFDLNISTFGDGE